LAPSKSDSLVNPIDPDPHLRSVADVVAALETNDRTGLSQTQAEERLRRWGRNELVSESPVPTWRKFIRQFADALVLLLIVAAGISAALWVYEGQSALPFEAIAILAIVLLNALMGYVQEARAEEAVKALRRISAARAKVIRDGAQQNIPAAELVPGDIILIEEGDSAPADARIIQTTALTMAEASLTGESLPVEKDAAALTSDLALGDRRNMVFSGTVATYGRGRGVTTATGMQTELGRIAGLLSSAREETTPLQKHLDRVGKLLGLVVIAISAIMVGTILLAGNLTSFSAIFDVLILGIALAVAAVPEGLPVIVTTVLSLGVQRMAKRNAIVRHLSAVETLGSAEVIASDKTGTLTRNEMTVRCVVTAHGRVDFGGTGYAPAGGIRPATGGRVDGALQVELEHVLTAADRANNAILQEQHGRWTVQGDPTEGALIVAARKVGLDKNSLDVRLPRIAEVPFSSERKLMSTVHTDPERREHLFVFTKGAPDVLLLRCTHERHGDETFPLPPERRAAILRTNENLAGEALRTLGIAFRPLHAEAWKREDIDDRVEQDLVFLGLIGMIDPPREEAKEAVRRARNAGIRPIMITGDHPKTAAVIALELGITADGGAVSGAELARMSERALDRTIDQISVYARVNPEHKLRIVQALQRRGKIVAMTGDGVNDAPALKTADIGVAMGMTGTDVSKEAADIVLTDDNFASIVAAIEEGRTIFANIRKFLRYLLSSNVGEVMTMFFGVLLAEAIGLSELGSGGVVLPLLATQILWINLVTDGAPALALGVDPADPDAMTRPPRPSSEGVITRQMWIGILLVGSIMAAGTLLVLDASLPGGFIEGSGTVPYAQTMAFTTLTLFQLFNVFNARSEEQSAFDGLWTNNWLWLAIGLGLLLHVAVIYVPFLQQAFSTVNLGITDWLLCAVVASSVLWGRELAKIVTRAGAR
jgi:Ca2+-transporting ATPase